MPNQHQDGCDCATCWEPRPLPGETMDDALAREFRKELRLMDERHLGMVIDMVAAEQQRRHPVKIVDADVRADPDQVKDLVGILVDAFNKRMDRNPRVEFITAFMALINFSRLVLEMIESQSEMDLEQKRAYRSAFVATVSRSLLSRVAN